MLMVQANLIAHAVLGAMEAHFTGNNATASTLGALTAYAVYKLTLLETLQSLNRDVANANQKLEKQDLQAIQES
ncbi:hypothetical protein P9Z71_11645, partial [Glaesserella parasuis]|nr:hypothetical protein [Glaesserella parasuis]MDG6449326.1 hypothetical protein [Glaesserella parasuis]